MNLHRKLSMPYWCVGNPVGDPFGPAVMDRVSSVAVTDILCEAKKDGLIDFTSAHDDDLVTWDPYNENDDTDPKSDTYKTLKTIKDKLERAGLQFKMATCSLHGDPVFRNGGITNPDPRVRLLAAKKVMRSLRIGHFLGAEYFTYWVARDGFETQFAVPWGRNYRYLMDGLNLVFRYTRENNLSIMHGTIENKPNEPRGEMYLPTVGHALAIISRLENPDFWGVNPELLQHEQMTGLSAVAAAGFAAFSVLYILNKMNWDGYLEFDNHILRTDAAPGKENAITLRRKFIELNIDAVRAAENKANQLADDSDIIKIQDRLWNSHQSVEKMLQGGDLQAIEKAVVDYKAVNEEPLELGMLDLVVNKKILGLQAHLPSE